MSDNLPLPDKNNAFDGETYEPDKDHIRLSGQLLRVFNLMSDGKWRSFAEIVDNVGGTEASVSARLRDFRKNKYGARIVERRRIRGGLFHYRLILEEETEK